MVNSVLGLSFTFSHTWTTPTFPDAQPNLGINVSVVMAFHSRVFPTS